jgi:hypothetical protein
LLYLGAKKVTGNVNLEYFVTEEGRSVTATIELIPEHLGTDPRDITWQYTEFG